MIKILTHKIKNNDHWEIHIERLLEKGISKKEKYEVEFFVDDVVINEGYKIYHPVDQAHFEPATTVSYITIEYIYLITKDDIEEVTLPDEEFDKLNEYIKLNYE